MVLWGCQRRTVHVLISRLCCSSGHMWALVIREFYLSFSQTAATLKRGNLRLSMLLSLVRASQPALLLTLVLYSSHTQILHLELLSCCSDLCPRSPLPVLSVGQWIISHSENWVWDVCLMPRMLQFMPRGTFYKFSGIWGQCTGQELLRSLLCFNCLYI